VVTSVGSRGDSYDNALAESVNGLDTTELVRRQGPWRGLEDLESATLNWVDFALKTLTRAAEQRIAAFVKQAVS